MGVSEVPHARIRQSGEEMKKQILVEIEDKSEKVIKEVIQTIASIVGVRVIDLDVTELKCVGLG
jgi:hypothetical protein